MNKILLLMKKMNITKRLLLYFLVLLAVQMILIGWFSYRWVSSYFERMYIDRMMEVNSSIVQQINYIRNDGEELSNRILSNKSIQKALLNNKNNDQAFYNKKEKDAIEDTLFDPTNKTYTVIVAENGIIYQSRIEVLRPSSLSEIQNTRVYKKSLESKGNNLWIADDEDIAGFSSNTFLYVCRTYNMMDIPFKRLGQLIIQMPISVLDDVFNKDVHKEGEYYAVIDNNGTYLYHSSNRNLLREKADEAILSAMRTNQSGYRIVTGEKTGNLLLTYSAYQENGWSLIHVLPMKVITSSAEKVRNYILLFMLLSLIISLPLLIFFSGNISRPVQKLESTVTLFGSGNLGIRTETNRLDEIGRLQISFNKMADHINNLLGKISEENKQRRLLELNMIEYQINPHFLYNSLDSINWMAQRAGNDDISDMVTALARFFRVGLSKGKEFIKIEDELEHIVQYLIINKIRFKDSFAFEIQAEPEILQYKTIKIILQPIVENAIKYGINKNGTTGFIKVTAKKENEAILFEVTDNGEGIPKNRLDTLQTILAKRTQVDDISGNGFGLFNVNQRLWLHFGEGYGITIDSNAADGTTVGVRIPVLQ